MSLDECRSAGLHTASRSERMPEQHNHDPQKQPTRHLHQCGNLFGCGDEQGTGVIREDIKDIAFTRRSSDRLLHMDEMDQENLDGYLSARGRSRRSLLRASSFMGALAAVGPWLTNLAWAQPPHAAGVEKKKHPTGSKDSKSEGKVHVVESSDKTVRLGVYDTTL